MRYLNLLATDREGAHAELILFFRHGRVGSHTDHFLFAGHLAEQTGGREALTTGTSLTWLRFVLSLLTRVLLYDTLNRFTRIT